MACAVIAVGLAFASTPAWASDGAVHGEAGYFTCSRGYPLLQVRHLGQQYSYAPGNYYKGWIIHTSSTWHYDTYTGTIPGGGWETKTYDYMDKSKTFPYCSTSGGT